MAANLSVPREGRFPKVFPAGILLMDANHWGILWIRTSKNTDKTRIQGNRPEVPTISAGKVSVQTPRRPMVKTMAPIISIWDPQMNERKRMAVTIRSVTGHNAGEAMGVFKMLIPIMQNDDRGVSTFHFDMEAALFFLSCSNKCADCMSPKTRQTPKTQAVQVLSE